MRIKESIGESVSCLDSEDMINRAYSGLLACMSMVEPNKGDTIVIDTCNGNRKRDFDTFSPLKEGIYIPGSKRNYWVGYVDPVDFPLPETGCVFIQSGYTEVDFAFITIKRIKKLPKKTVCQCKKPKYVYKAFNFYTRNPKLGNHFCSESYFAIGENGEVYTVVDLLKLRDPVYNTAKTLFFDNENISNFSAGAISLLADRRYIWNIRTSEPFTINDAPATAVVNFGVEEEMVKSLVFARDEPLTPSDRKRPILHWVRSHKRRLANNIDINIQKHLRGITDFKMGELDFQITEPVKKIKQGDK